MYVFNKIKTNSTYFLYLNNQKLLIRSNNISKQNFIGKINKIQQNLPNSLKQHNFFYNYSTINKQNQSLLHSTKKYMQKQQSQKQQSQGQFIEQQNPVAEYQSQLFQEMATYQKDTQKQNFKTRGTKRKQKLEQLRSSLKNPELRRQRNRQRHQKQKQKLQKQLIGLSEQQIRQILDKKKKQKQQKKQKVRQAVQQQIGQTFMIDIAYEHKMNEKQNKSLAAQIELIVKALKQTEIPPNVHLCGVRGKVEEQLNKMNYEHWPIKSFKEDLSEYLKIQKFKGRNVYYLSPDAPQSVHNIEKNDIFIIGGLVDRTVIKNASLNRAQQLGIESRSLPIRPFMKQRTCLNLDHIVAIICKFNQVQDWKIAFDYGAPKRWKKDIEKVKKQKKQQKDDKVQNNSQNSQQSDEQFEQNQYQNQQKQQ